MYNPNLYEMPVTQEMITAFGGYDCNSVIPDNCFSDQVNMGADKFPLISPRNKRGFFNITGDDLHGLFAKSEIAYIKDSTLFYGGKEFKGLSFPPVYKKRKIVSMGARLLIFPDNVYINTADLTDYGYLEATFISEEGTPVTCSFSKGDGDLYEDYIVSSVEPEEVKNGDLWLDTSVIPNELKQYTESLGVWLPLAEAYIRISCKGIGKKFNLYDGVTLSGFKDDELNGSHIIQCLGDDFIVISGVLKELLLQTNTVTVARKLPEMDFVCESGNRIWGCNSEKNEIYASKLGDPTNFNSFMGISTDSYAVTVGTDGDFTGAVAFRGYVIFFKESCIHKIYGQNPPYTVNTSYLRGVQKGCEKSICIVNETLYYKSPNGICAYQGGVPVDISRELGGKYYTNAVGGTRGDKYYICMTDKNHNRVLFNYDESKNVWSKEDNIDISEFALHNGNLYFIATVKGEKRLGLTDGENIYGDFPEALKHITDEEPFEWSCCTGVWGIDIPENKYYSGIVIRFAGEKGARLCVDYRINSNGKWVNTLDVPASSMDSAAFPVSVPRCDHVELRISGRGKATVFGISRKIETGSELNV